MSKGSKSRTLGLWAVFMPLFFVLGFSLGRSYQSSQLASKTWDLHQASIENRQVAETNLAQAKMLREWEDRLAAGPTLAAYLTAEIKKLAAEGNLDPKSPVRINLSELDVIVTEEDTRTFREEPESGPWKSVVRPEEIHHGDTEGTE